MQTWGWELLLIIYNYNLINAKLCLVLLLIVYTVQLTKHGLPTLMNQKLNYTVF